MLEVMASPQAFPFTLALGVFAVLFFLELVSTVIGASVSSIVDSWFPDFDVDVDLDADLDVDGDVDVAADAGGGFISEALTWLRFGRVPVIMLLAIFLVAFGVVGLSSQTLIAVIIGTPLPAWLASVFAIAVTLPIVRITGGWLERILPRDQTSAVSQRTFVGRVAHIVIGTARPGQPAEARLHDEHGRSHYVMVEPDLESAEFGQGEPVLLVRIDGPRFRVIAPPSGTLLDAE